MTTLFVNKLTNIDFSYLDPELGLVGESWLMDIQLAGDLNEQGMVLDFGIVKKQAKAYVDTYIDHCLVVPTAYAGCEVVAHDERLVIDFALNSGATIHHESISSAVSLIAVEQINTETMRDNILSALKKHLPENVQHIDVQLYPQPDLDNYYRYSHGLQQHDGNCQRIAHGHRSDLKILIDEQPSEEWKSYWTDLWRDIYIGTSAHVLDDSGDNMVFEYVAPQGKFLLHMPKESCYLINTETTVENIAQHLADETAKKVPGKTVKVIAFEGIAKGAIAVAGPV